MEDSSVYHERHKLLRRRIKVPADQVEVPFVRFDKVAVLYSVPCVSSVEYVSILRLGRKCKRLGLWIHHRNGNGKRAPQ